MATYAYQQNVFDGASYGYIKYNISPDFGKYVAPGTRVTITGQAYFKNSAKKSIEVETTASGQFKYAYVNVSIPKATVTSFTLTFKMWELSSAWGTGRVLNAPIQFTMFSGANMGGSGDGTVAVAAQKISYLTYSISPTIKNAEFERYSLSGSTYKKNDEGSYVLGKLAISLASGRTASDITVKKAVVSSSAGTTQTITLSASVLTSALSASGYSETAPGLFSSISFNTAYNYTITFTIGDAYETAVFVVLIARAFANMHLSGLSTGGVAFGRFSSATQNNPKLESDYPAYLYGGIKELTLSWQKLAPASGVTTPNTNNYGGGALQVTKIGSHVIIRGGVLAKSGATLANIPSGYYPTDGNRYKLVPCGGSRVARLYVNVSGVFKLEWVRNLSDGAEYTTALWVDCNMDYWLD